MVTRRTRERKVAPTQPGRRRTTGPRTVADRLAALTSVTQDGAMAGRVLIVDDHARFRAAARRMLESEGWEVVGEAVDGGSGLASAAELTPDVVLLDVGLPDLSGVEVARRLRVRQPEVAVVLVSTRDAGDYQQAALSSGACGFLPKADLSGEAIGLLVAR